MAAWVDERGNGSTAQKGYQRAGVVLGLAMLGGDESGDEKGRRLYGPGTVDMKGGGKVNGVGRGEGEAETDLVLTGETITLDLACPVRVNW